MTCAYDFKPWVGFDLDGTLAEYHEWGKPIGKPIKRMIDLLLLFYESGKINDFDVKIFTARAYHEEDKLVVVKWLKKHNLPDLEVTCIKDHGFRFLFDDRATRVIKNSGCIIEMHYKMSNDDILNKIFDRFVKC
jgi:uncharacterized protein YggL (DUF469 family)